MKRKQRRELPKYFLLDCWSLNKHDVDCSPVETDVFVIDKRNFDKT